MDLAKTGNFIKQQRKAKGLTQNQLADLLFVSEKTISKWECGKGFPDTTLILPLCQALDITANELLSAKRLNSEEYKNSAEDNLITLKSQNETYAKHLLAIEWVVVWLSLVVFVSSTLTAAYFDMALIWKVLLFVFGLINILIGVGISLVIETKAGFYQCGKCGHQYIPSYKQTLFSTHLGRTRKMRCPNCKQKSWHKKIMQKN